MKPENIKALDNLKYLELLVKDLKEEKRKVNINIEMTNTGITELPIFGADEYKNYADLGGRNIRINIDIPNNKTLEEAIKEHIKKSNAYEPYYYSENKINPPGYKIAEINDYLHEIYKVLKTC